jgi:hypothetical protein
MRHRLALLLGALLLLAGCSTLAVAAPAGGGDHAVVYCRIGPNFNPQADTRDYAWQAQVDQPGSSGRFTIGSGLAVYYQGTVDACTVAAGRHRPPSGLPILIQWECPGGCPD